MASAVAAASSAPVCLQDVPHELLARILSLAWRDNADGSAEALFRVGSLCHALRAAAGATATAAELTPVWSRAIIALVDPAAALATASGAATDEGFMHACYLRHAVALGSWYALAHALSDRNCVACGEVTRWLAWRDPEAAHAVAVGADEDGGGGGPLGSGLCRCCATCAPPAEGAQPGRCRS